MSYMGNLRGVDVKVAREDVSKISTSSVTHHQYSLFTVQSSDAADVHTLVKAETCLHKTGIEIGYLPVSTTPPVQACHRLPISLAPVFLIRRQNSGCD